MLVTLTARDADCAQGNNRLLSIDVTAFANGTVTWPGSPPTTVSAPTSLTIPGTPATYQFTMVRAAPGATTVSFVVHDGCGAWPTFVGGGPGAF
jgi:hypothetical protein